MRAKEFISESKRDSLPGDYSDVMPDLVSYPGAFNPYHRYRLVIAAAGAPDYDHEFVPFGPFMDEMTSLNYTKADKEIMDQAHKKMGYKPRRLSSKGSSEQNQVNTVSPISNWNKK
jgi:hypothetical protein